MELTPGYQVLYAENLEEVEKQINAIITEAISKARPVIFCGGVSSYQFWDKEGVRQSAFMQAIYLPPAAPSGIAVPTLSAKMHPN
jgi:hypothetical protein